MIKLTRSDLLSLEEYSEQRVMFRSKVMEHKKTRNVALSENARLYFEDEMTIRYQIQEMLRIEKVFDAAGIEDELEAYNPLLPEGSNWKATFMLEYTDVDERKQKVTELIGVERKAWVQVEGCEKVFAIADEDMDREDGERTSTVHFLRFELDPTMVASAKHGAAVKMGVEHPNLMIETLLTDPVRDSLVNDLQEVSLN